MGQVILVFIQVISENRKQRNIFFILIFALNFITRKRRYKKEMIHMSIYTKFLKLTDPHTPLL